MIFKRLPKTLIYFTLLCTSLTAMAQDEPWWVNYLVEKDSSFMGVTINMDYQYARPSYKNLLLVGSSTEKCYQNGFPTGQGLEDFYKFSDATAPVVDSLTKNSLVGIITYKCTGIDVYYVKDTTNLRSSLSALIKKDFSGAQNYIFIENDKKWDYYKRIYPGEVNDNFLMNQSFLNQLAYEGDDLGKQRKVSHWAYFKNDKNRSKFIDKIQVLDFKVDTTRFIVNKNLPFEVELSRTDSITPRNIEDITKLLTSLSLAYKGVYDGWGTEAVKEEEPNQ
ncbi:MAG: DUF695 domain-containing protein [Flavobacteriaceae bacterium]|nr:DUF695 domain-containing protein [Flavobacteriaceae bacterium]MCB0474345.1 DUF695 domain-containing protein [Flavobacteriaceae bacterium]